MAPDDLKGALEGADEIKITVRGRRSGREISHPVWFARDGDRLYLIPVRGSHTGWYRNLLETPTMRVTVDGAEQTAHATALTDATKVQEVVEKFEAKYGADRIDKGYESLDVAVEIPLV
jgi:deazaflavin-dependent oxidoreductase (nitroreductase family)